MTILKNNLLFNHTYLKELTADTTIDPQIPFSPKDLRDWYSFLDTSSTRTMVDTWVRPMLSLLELEIHPLDSDDEHAFKLTTAYDHATAIGACYVTPPGADLDTTTKGRFWMAQAVLAARRHEPALRWVILTNGDLWRLLDAQALRRYEAYVQIDVGQLARGISDPSALRVFFRCFHRRAFDQIDNKTGLEKLLEASDHATEKAEKHLNERVSGTDGIMAQLCLGLVRSTGKSKFTEREEDAIYRDATTLLYRMLFLLYAESRQLLPIDNPKYAELSMASLIELARIGQQHGLDHPQDTSLWERLKRISNAIYESDPDLDIPAYNGGLFDDDDHPFLRDGTIADQYLSRAIFDLAFLPNSNDVQAIDYRDLSVRHLGSLYEGMIEYKLFVAEEPMLARRDKKGNIHFQTQKEGGGLRRNDQEIKTGEVYFAQSSGERRATGTYYTPEYIVDYIVRNTVVRGLEKRRASIEEKLKGWLDEIRVTDPDERPGLQRTVDEELLKFVEKQVLTFTVCDPAMGSGHFLVNAAHHIANFIVETLNLSEGENQSLDIEPGYWRRRAVERGIYGVDVSEMAVELAKLSLWLATMAQGKPLSFLKHRLRQGNSLIGARMEEIKVALAESTAHKKPSRKEQELRKTGQLSMLEHPAFSHHMQAATSLLERISGRIAQTLEDVKAQEADYDQAQIELAPLKKLADLLVAQYFGLSVEKDKFISAAKYILNENNSISPLVVSILEETSQVSSRWLFFHWEFEFPDQMLSRTGFDSVIGNPPYLNFKQYSSEERNRLKHSYSKVFDGKADILYYFIFKGVEQLCNQNSYLGFIVSRYWFQAEFASNLRNYISENVTIEEILDFRNIAVFENVGIKTCLVLFRNSHPSLDHKLVYTPYEETIQLKQIASEQPIEILQKQLVERGKWEFYTPKSFQVLKKIEQKSVILAEVADCKQGVVTGLDKAFVVSDRAEIGVLNSEILKPWVKVGDIFRFGIFPTEKRFLIYTNYIKDISIYPDLLTRLNYYRTKLSQRREAKNGKIRWFDLQWSRTTELFDSEKLICRFKASQNTFAYDDSKLYSSADTTLVVVKQKYKNRINLKYLLALLNSNLLDFYFKSYAKLMDYRYEYYPKPVSMLRIRLIEAPHQKQTQHHEIVGFFAEEYEKYISSGKIKNLLNFVDSLLKIPEKIYLIQEILVILSELMTDLKRQVYQYQQEFINWMTSQIGVSVEDLTNKTQLFQLLENPQINNHHLDITTITNILISNERKLTVDPRERTFRYTLEQSYEKSLEELFPIKRRIDLTDSLIDQIVYRLYGLTDEEIAIVEGKA